MTELTNQKDNPSKKAERSSKWKSFRSGLLFTFGILLPLGTLVFEAVTGMCAGMLFDPIPTIGHALLVAVVPSANFLVWLALTKNYQKNLIWLGLLNGAAIAISFYYALLFLPVLPIAVIGFAAIIYFGIGLLSFMPMSPLFSFVSSIRYRRLTQLYLCKDGRLPGLWRGILLAMALLIAISLPDVVTKVGLRLAASPNQETNLVGIKWLRAMGRDDIMLRACYQVPSGPVDLVSWVVFLDSKITTEMARKTYFRVTGRSFDTKPAPNLWAGRRGRWAGADEFDFDMEQGGEVVAGRLKGLSLSDSRLDGSVNADAALAYLEWTMVFRNDSSRQREARAQILLPPGAVVSRLTLWIDGEEREAAFGGRGRVREAYRKVVRRRRDPVLVTTCGPDRIMMQCFPVPPNGGEMKTRIGITVPLTLLQADTGLLLLPRTLERNFGIADEKAHSIWIEGNGAFSSGSDQLLQEKNKEGSFTIRGELTSSELNSVRTSITITRDPADTVAWATDETIQGEYGVIQILSEQPIDAPDRIVVVIDGSAEMDKHLQAIATALESVSPRGELAVLLAGDKVLEVFEPQSANPTNIQVMTKKLIDLKCVGGQDNTEALLKGWDLAAQSKKGVILWIHGPQWYLLSAGEQLRQRFERRPEGPALYEIQTEHGPNRLIQKMDGLIPIHHVSRKDNFQNDLMSVLKSWQIAEKRWIADRDRMLLSELPQDRGEESSRHLVRLWAHDRIMKDFTSGEDRKSVV